MFFTKKFEPIDPSTLFGRIGIFLHYNGALAFFLAVAMAVASWTVEISESARRVVLAYLVMSMVMWVGWDWARSIKKRLLGKKIKKGD